MPHSTDEPMPIERTFITPGKVYSERSPAGTVSPEPVARGAAWLLGGALKAAKAIVGIDRASDDEIAVRLKVCGGCPNGVGGGCRLCGCSIALKVRLRTECCPDNPPRWPTIPS